jgi:ABC-type branched-subunit amino acid transport system ATPase component
MSTSALASAPSLTQEEEREVAQQYEERADHLLLDAFPSQTALTSDAEEWIRSLTGSGAKLLVGPRGCGKTHLMRFAFMRCVSDPDLPLAVYINLNRYYTLEPLLRRRPDAMSTFYVWVLANIMVGCHESIGAFKRESLDQSLDVNALLEFNETELRDLIGAYEKNQLLSIGLNDVASRLTIDRVKQLLLRCADALGRKRVVLLLDDAALTLTPEYLSHFFDIYRALKASRIAPKASVYPGTTEYGPNFHAGHEADTVFVWKRVTDQDYLPFMLDIGAKRFPDMASVPVDIRELLAYSAFGVPRAFMTLVRSYLKNEKRSLTAQSAFNVTIDEFLADRVREYLTLKDKKPQFSSIVSVGKQLLDRMVESVYDANQMLIDGATRQLYIGIDSSGVNDRPYVQRMLLLLQEAGMVYAVSGVSHGDRDYVRFVPHLAAVQARRAFAKKGGFSPKFAVEMLSRPDEKHPVRRSMSTLLDSSTLEALCLDLPSCLNCQAKRVEGAKYCFNCGEKLTDESTYDKLILTSLADVPGLTPWQREKLSSSGTLPKTVGEFIALQDPGTTLRTIHRVGQVRAKTIIDAVQAFLDDYLS